jgi:hypothetical protein
MLWWWLDRLIVIVKKGEQRWWLDRLIVIVKKGEQKGETAQSHNSTDNNNIKPCQKWSTYGLFTISISKDGPFHLLPRIEVLKCSSKLFTYADKDQYFC